MVKAITYLLLHDLHACTFKSGSHHLFTPKQNTDRKNVNDNCYIELKCYIELMNLLKLC